MPTVPFHTHNFSIPTATDDDMEVLTSASVVVTPANLTNPDAAATIVDIAAPPASQAEAEAGTDAVKRMTPRTTAQAIDARALTPSDVGTTVGTVAAGNDSRIVGALQSSQNLTDLANLGLAQDAVQTSVGFVSKETAVAATIPARNKRAYTSAFDATLTPGSAAWYRRATSIEAAAVPAAASMRTADRFLPDGSTDASTGGYWVLDEAIVDWRMLGVKGNGTDETTVAQTAVNYVLNNPAARKLVLSGTVYVSKITLSGAQGISVESNNCTIVGNSLSAQTALLEVKTPDTSVNGRLVLNCLYKTNYECAFHAWHESAMQFCDFSGIIGNGAKIAYRVGNTTYPAALISEMSFSHLETYGCPVAFEVIGGETYIQVDNPQLSSDAFGTGDAGWVALPRITLRNIGASINVSGGEMINVQSTTGVVHEMQPINRGGGRVEWGSTVFNGVFCETASPLSRTANPGGFTINNSASNRRGMIQFNNCIGFHSQDLTAFIYTDPSYDDFVIVNSPGFWKPGADRTQPNIYCEVGSTAEVTVIGDWGPGFQKGLSGLANGRLNFSRRTLLIASNLNGQDFVTGVPETCLFSQVNTVGDRARYQGTYSSGTGIFTVPDGGLEDVSASFVLRMLTDGVTGTAALFLDNTEVASVAIVSSRAALNYDLGNLNAGQNLRVVIQNVSTSTFANATSSYNRFSVTAKRGYV